MQTITANLTAGVRREFSLAPAMFFMLLETVGPVDVEIQSGEGRVSEIAKGVESGFREKAISGSDKISKVIFTSPTDQSIKFGHSVRDADNRKVTSTVSVVDGSVERTIAGRAFKVWSGIAGVSAKYAIAEIRNTSTDKNLIIEAIVLSHESDVMTYLSLARFFAPIIKVVEKPLMNKKIGGSNIEDGEFWVDQVAAIPGRTEMESAKKSNGDLWHPKMEGPYVIPPGEGIGMACHTTGKTMYVSLAGYTEAAA